MGANWNLYNCNELSKFKDSTLVKKKVPPTQRNEKDTKALLDQTRGLFDYHKFEKKV